MVVLSLAIASSGPFAPAQARAGEPVEFNSAVSPPTAFQIKRAKQNNTKPKSVPAKRISGNLILPGSTGRHPAIVLMHGCGGIWRWNDVWSERLAGWGYVVLDVDSLGPRGVSSVCNRPGVVPGHIRGMDAHGAKQYLSKHPSVDPERIGIMGMSHGGWATLNALVDDKNRKLKLAPFKAGVALYPWCDEPQLLDAPLLILSGALDDWTPAERCQRFAHDNPSPGLELIVFSDAHHVFDLEGTDRVYGGHLLKYHAESARKAAAKIRDFLQKHLKK